MNLQETEELPTRPTFRKKVYSTHYSSPLSDSVRSSSIESFKHRFDGASTTKKIRPTHALSGMREEFKRFFLPLYIDIFKLRQMVASYKSASQMPIGSSRNVQSPNEIMQRLLVLQKEIDESQRWCEGMALQITKAIEEAKEALDCERSAQTPLSRVSSMGWIARLKTSLKIWRHSRHEHNR